MALSTSSRFISLSFYFRDGAPRTFDYLTTDNDSGSASLDKPEQHHTNADLAILQQIYASADGFLDVDGNAFIPHLAGVPFGLSIDELEEYGIWNPLDSGSYARWAKQQEANSLILQGEGDFSRDATTGLPTVEHGGNFKVTETEATGQTIPADLLAWTVSQISSTRVRFMLLVRESDEIEAADFDNYRHVAAFHAWLESVREGGSAVGTATDNGPATYGQGRQFEFRQDTSDTEDIILTYHEVERTAVLSDDASTFYITQYTVDFNVDASGASLNISDLRDYIDNVETTISSDTYNILGQIQSPGNHMEVGGLDFGGGVRMTPIDGGLILEAKDDNNKRYKIFTAGNYGRTISYSSLKTVSGYKTIPRAGHIENIEFLASETSAGTVRIPVPPDLLLQEGNHVRIGFRNNNSTYNLTIEDWNGDTLLVLRRAEYAEFQITLENGGDGQLTAIQIPKRRLVRSAGATGDLTDGLSLHDDDADTRYRGFPFPVNPDYVDYDAFGISPTAPPAATQNFETYASYIQRDAWRVERNGRMEIDFTCVLEVGSSNAIPNNHGIIILEQPGGSGVAQEGKRTTVPELATADGRTSYSIRDVINVSLSDRFMMAFVYPENASVTWSQIFVRGVQLTVTFEPDIIVSYTA